MKEFLDKIKAGLQDQLSLMNSDGCRLSVRENEDRPFINTLAVECTVTRVAPRFTASGEYLRSDFWLLWKEIGYQEGLRYAHSIKVVDICMDDSKSVLKGDATMDAWLAVELTDDLGRIHRLEVIEPFSEPEQAADWKAWLKFRSKNKEMFASLDAQIAEEHAKIVEAWE